jgi:hypothetical protein
MELLRSDSFDAAFARTLEVGRTEERDPTAALRHG